MSVTYEELQRKTIAELREIAKGIQHEAVQGYTQMNKEHLVPALCTALAIDAHVHHHTESGFAKSAVKARLRMLKTERQKAVEAHDGERLHALRREMHVLNHRIRVHTV